MSHALPKFEAPAYTAENMDAERSVIAAVTLDESRFPAFAHLRPEHFAIEVHQQTWAHVCEQVKAGRPVTIPGIKAALRGHRGLASLDEAWMGGDYLGHITEKASIRRAGEMAQLILDDYTRRSAVAVASNVVALATEANPRPAVEVVSYLRHAVAELEHGCAASDTDFVAANDVAASVVAQLAENMRSGKVRGKRTGLRCIDYRCGGLHGGSLIVVAGRPGMGKTALARAIAHGAAVHNPADQILFLGMEMSPGEMMERELSANSYDIDPTGAVEYRDMGRGSLSAHDMATVSAAQQRVPANLILRDCAALSLDDVRRLIWSLKRKGSLALVVIDYLGLMRKPDAHGRNEASLVAEITMGLKQLARQAKCAIVLLSQLNRQVEARDDKRPMLSDLRESGAIEQDADFVLFPFRHVYYLERSKPAKGKEADHDMEVARLQTVMEVICAKARRGAVGTDRQVYRAEYDHISDEAAQ